MVSDSHKVLWDQCREVIRQNVTQEQYNALFAYTDFSEYADGKLVLSVPSQFIFDMLERDDYASLIRKTINRFFGENVTLCYKIPVVKVKGGSVQVSNIAHVDTQNGPVNQHPNQAPSGPVAPVPQDLDSQLHKGYFFDNYVEGESNRLARSVGEAIAKNPAKTFNPFFIFGPSGCGKTHLVNAIGWRIKELHPELRVLYLSAHLFSVQYTDAVRQNKTNDFINFYQTIDVLIFDDIQEFAGKTKTQNTFFHIFNHLHLNNKQLILTADRPPMKIQDLEDRLLTRFKWGLQAEIEKPTKELRYQILKNNVRMEGLNVPDEVIRFIAENVDESVRDLEGIINSLIAHSIVENCDISMQLVKKILPRFVNVEESHTSIEEITHKVCEFYHLKEEVIISKSRKQEIVRARQIAIYLASQYTNETTVQIGRAIGGKKHATVLHSINLVKTMMETDIKFRQDVRDIEAILK